MTADGELDDARTALLEQFRWITGHADVWRCFADARTLQLVVRGLADPWRDGGITHVCGIEARGFLLGGAVALQLGAGFVGVRKTDGLFPGPKVTRVTALDYREQQHTLRLRRDLLRGADRVLLVDDWAERGAQALAVRAMVEECGATFAGVALVVDQLEAATRAQLAPVVAIVAADELGASA